jgi:transcription antitermination factor NusG
MESNDDLRRQWFVLFIASNNEKQVQKHLLKRDIETFLPLYTVTRRWKNRTTVKLELPLFVGYMFARFAREESSRVLEVPMVYSVVGNRHGSLAIPEEEINALRVGLIAGKTEPHPFLTVGRRARIRSGPLGGWEGIITRVDSALRVVLTVNSIRRSFSVHVESDAIEILDDERSDVDPPIQPYS